MQILHVQDKKANGTPGQSFSGGVYETCHLDNVLANTIPDATVSGNEITLPGGNYLAWGKNTGPAGAKRLAVCDTTSGAALPDAVLVPGVNGASGGPGSSLHTSCQGHFFLAAPRKIKLMLDSAGGAAPASGLTTDEIYSDLLLIRLDLD